MEEEIKKRLDAAIQLYTQRQKANRENQQRTEEEVILLQRFEKIKTDVIRPAMESFVNYLSEYGWESRISATEDSITLRLFPEDPEKLAYGPLKFPLIDFYILEDKEKVILRARVVFPERSVHEGQYGEFDLKDITNRLVYSKICDIVEEIYSFL